MTNPLVLLDMDRTVLNTDFSITRLEYLKVQIRVMLRHDWRIGISSDRPLHELMHFYDLLGLNGPVVCENGAFIYVPELNAAFFTQNKIYAQKFSIFHLDVVSLLKKKFPDVDIMIGDNLNMLSILDRAEHRKEMKIALISSGRDYSFAVNVRHYRPSEPNPTTRDLLEPISKEILELFMSSFELDPNHFISYETFGCLIIHLPTNGKHVAAKRLLGELGHDRIIMIGDSKWDNLHDDRVYQMGVANATEEYKECCDFVSEYEFCDGARDCLEKIDGLS